MKKGFKLLGLVLVFILMMGLVACGSDNGETNTPSDKIEADTNSSDNTDIQDSSENDSSNETGDEDSEKPNITTAKEKDIVVYIAGKEVKLDQTWEEFQQMLKDYGWAFTDDRTNSWPGYDEEENEYNYKGSGFVQTPIGKVKFSFMENEEKNGSVMRAIHFITEYIAENNFNVCGVNLTTTWDEAGKALEFVGNEGSGNSYKVDEWVEIYIEKPHEGKSNIIIERTMFHMRNK